MSLTSRDEGRQEVDKNAEAKREQCGKYVCRDLGAALRRPCWRRLSHGRRCVVHSGQKEQMHNYYLSTPFGRPGFKKSSGPDVGAT